MSEQKTLILSAVDGSNKKAVLNVESKGEICTGSLRLYNFTEVPKGILSLGFLNGNDVCKAVLTDRGRGLFSFEANPNSSLDKFSCALVNIKNGDATPILIGATDGKANNDLSSRLASNFSILDDEDLTVEKTTEFLNNSQIDYDTDEKEMIDKAISAELGGCEKCSKCGYRNAFYGNCQTEETSTKTFARFKTIAKQTETFYDEIKEQLATLFEKYPEETFLTEVIPNSKWAKVDYEDNGEYFVIGLIYENEKVSYVCYGVPGEFSKDPPRELSNGNSQWLPLDPNNPEELGYWITYQDADSGENVKVNIS